LSDDQKERIDDSYKLEVLKLLVYELALKLKKVRFRVVSDCRKP
jgi:hypothetical protein